MSEEIEGNVIYIPIEVRLSDKEQIREFFKEIDNYNKTLKEMGIEGKGSRRKEKSEDKAFDDILEDAVNDAIDEAIDDAIKEGGKLSLKSLLEKGGFDQNDWKTWFNLVRNPKGFFINFFGRALPILGGLLAAKDVAQFIFDELTARGRPFDLTFRRLIREEYNALRGRELRQEIRQGFRQYITTPDEGIKFDPSMTVNTLELVRNGQIFEMDNFRIRYGSRF